MTTQPRPENPIWWRGYRTLPQSPELKKLRAREHDLTEEIRYRTLYFGSTDWREPMEKELAAVRARIAEIESEEQAAQEGDYLPPVKVFICPHCGTEQRRRWFHTVGGNYCNQCQELMD